MGKCSLIKDPFVYSKFHREKSMQKCNRQLLHSAKPTRGTLRKEGKLKRGPGYLLQVHSGKLSLAAYLCGKWGFVFRATPLRTIAPLAPRAVTSRYALNCSSPSQGPGFLSNLQLLISNTFFSVHLDEGVKRILLPSPSVTSWFSPEVLPF